MKAIWNDTVIAEAEKDDLIYIEGNWYFPGTALKKELTSPSSLHTVCPWKGEASYLNLEVDGQTNADAVWFYPQPLPTAFERTKKDFTNYVAFWRGVQVTD